MPSLHSQLWKCELNTSAYEHPSAPADSVHTRLCQADTALKLPQGAGEGLGSYGTDRHYFSFLGSSYPKPGKKIEWEILQRNFSPSESTAFFHWFFFFSPLYLAYLAPVQDMFTIVHADCSPSHFAMCLGCPGEDKRGFLCRSTKTALKTNCWKSPLPISSGEAQHWLHPRGATTHTTSSTLLQASARGKRGSSHLVCKHHGKGTNTRRVEKHS